MEEYKEIFLKNLLRAFEKECKDLGFKYLIAVDKDIRIHATPIYLANAIIETLKGLPPEGRERTIRLMLEAIEEEEEDIEEEE